MLTWLTCCNSPRAGVLRDTFGIFMNDFLTGFSVGVVFFLLIFLLTLLIRRRHRSRGIMIHGGSGFLFVTPVAVREFAARVLDEFNEASLGAVTLRQFKDQCDMTIGLQISPDADVITLVEDILRRIIHQAVAKLGMQKTLKVNVNIRGFGRIEKTVKSDSAKRNIMTGFPVAGAVPPEESDF